MDTTETVVDPSLEDTDPLGSFAPENRTGDVVSADKSVKFGRMGPRVAEVASIRAIRARRARIRRAGFRARLLTHLKHLDTTVRARWARSRNWNSVRRLKTVRIRREVSRWTIRFSIFAVGVAVGALTPSAGSRSNMSSQLAPSAAGAARTTASGASPVAVGTVLVGLPSSPAPAPAALPPRSEASPRAPGHRGTLIVTSQPRGASVFVNNRLAGQTPLVMNALPAGSRAVRLSLDGYAAWSRGVRVVANQSTTVSAKLELSR